VKAFAELRGLNGPQWRAFAAAYLGWTLDAFDYFLLVMVATHVADEFHTTLKVVTYGLFLTLAMRPVGALLFGVIADRYGRRPALMGSILLYAAVELLTGFAPSLQAFFILRALFGIGMGGEWGVGASLAMETVPAASRGVLSGILQEGYPMGYLLAVLVNGIAYPSLGWRGMFFLGAVPAVVAVFVRLGVQESPAWVMARSSAERSGAGATAAMFRAVRERWPLFVYMVVLMTVFNCFSHGTQDLYPSGFLEKARGLALGTRTKIALIYNVGAILGGMAVGTLSQRIGRRRAIALSAVLALPVIPLWVGSGTPASLAVGAFLLQFAVQGAWGVVPAHLSELSPASVRGTFPGFAYQVGNLCASMIVTVQATIAESHGYPLALGSVVAVFAVVLAILALCGPEARSADLSAA
jgi:SHS family lactate transporter-like MFS transporter